MMNISAIHPVITERMLFNSVVGLCFEIHRLHYDSNMLTGEAAKRNEFFFSDAGVPKPRPLTGLAWASLCAIGPCNGYAGFKDHKPNLIPWMPTDGKFIVPYLPKLLPNDDMTQSLTRQSKLHVRDDEGRISWGQIYIGDSATGKLTEQLGHGQRVAKEWAYPHPKMHLAHTNQVNLWPLHSLPYEGWQFGVIQSIPGMSIDLRWPFTQLASQGIPLGKMIHSQMKIKRLMFRFMNPLKAIEWADAYGKAMNLCLDRDAVAEDDKKLTEEIKIKADQKLRELDDSSTKSKIRKKAGPSGISLDSLLSNI